MSAKILDALDDGNEYTREQLEARGLTHVPSHIYRMKHMGRVKYNIQVRRVQTPGKPGRTALYRLVKDSSAAEKQKDGAPD